MIDLTTLTIEKAHADLSTGVYTVRELCGAYLAVIAEKNPEIHAYLEVFDDVMMQADAAQARFTAGTATLLTGIPLAVKDNMLIEGKRVSAASKMLEGYVASYTATATKRLLDANAIFLGRTNMDEFAMGSSTENSAFGVTKNPHDLSRVAGGTSGGSAAAVAAFMALGALGSDTGGSVRQPAAFCGVVGLKPSYGAVSRYGLIADTSSFDQIGPIAKTVRDAEIIFECIQGRDPMDVTSEGVRELSNEASETKRVIGVPRSYLTGDGVDPELLVNFNATLERLAAEGHTIVDIEIPLLEYALSVYYILQPAEVASNLSRLDGIRYGLSVKGDSLYDVYAKSRGQGFGPETRRRILLGTYILSHGHYDAYYRKADALRNEIGKSFAKVFDRTNGGVDAILLPTTPNPAFKIGEKTKDPVSMYLEDIFTVPLNIAGVSGISVPSGKMSGGLPLGIQVVAAKGDDRRLLQIGKELERVVQ
jgi:aspartyl-tRNA(Asn)/glutamyl-tRNA(Gln) amidotransferase subunit A